MIGHDLQVLKRPNACQDMQLHALQQVCKLIYSTDATLTYARL